MSKFVAGQRVKSTVTEEARSLSVEETEALASVLVSLGIALKEEVEEDIKNEKNSPIIGDIGTVIREVEGQILVEWGREIGPTTGKRENESQWWVMPEEIELAF